MFDPVALAPALLVLVFVRILYRYLSWEEGGGGAGRQDSGFDCPARGGKGSKRPGLGRWTWLHLKTCIYVSIYVCIYVYIFIYTCIHAGVNTQFAGTTQLLQKKNAGGYGQDIAALALTSALFHSFTQPGCNTR